MATELLLCNELPGASPFDRAEREDRVTPVKVFDNLYYIGTQRVGSWALKTSQGIILINALHTQWVNSTLLPGLKKVGLNPADVKYVVVTQDEGDHYGGAKYFQDKYAARVLISSADWDGIGRGGGGRGAARSDSARRGGRSPGQAGRGVVAEAGAWAGAEAVEDLVAAAAAEASAAVVAGRGAEKEKDAAARCRG
jgi:glyoxylase-like metal-dependent hydrolase (beta-lactamase superfamily II)